MAIQTSPVGPLNHTLRGCSQELLEGDLDPFVKQKNIGKNGKIWIIHEGRIIIGGHFNIRIEQEDFVIDEKHEVRRRSKDKGEFTYVGARGSTVIDYIIVNGEVEENVDSFRVEDRIESDHAPVCVYVKAGKYVGRSEQEQEMRTGASSTKFFSWLVDDILGFKQKTEEIPELEGSVKGKWEQLKKIIQGAGNFKELKARKKWKIGMKR
ncbi:hypothetical protein QAD02_008581 [Eretmocerus hayati]|uniref:Uncharacterized protein n=1 Tax=Eretmocerus hayati TaxID=131215 RepID=A0ACC2N9B2_9HYME|nr:hypothetical protein QAD02_008581 [Eretmocerus hayati]